MTSRRWETLCNLFAKAADLPAEEWPAFLHRNCGADTALFRELKQLLAELDDNDALIRDAISEQATDFATLERPVTWRIGLYMEMVGLTEPKNDKPRLRVFYRLALRDPF